MLTRGRAIWGSVSFVVLLSTGCVTPIEADLSEFAEFEYAYGPDFVAQPPPVQRASIQRGDDGGYSVEIIGFEQGREIRRSLTDLELQRVRELFAEITYRPLVVMPPITDVGPDTFRWDGIVLFDVPPIVGPVLASDDAQAIVALLEDLFSDSGG